MPDSSELGPGFILGVSGCAETAGTPRTHLLKATTQKAAAVGRQPPRMALPSQDIYFQETEMFQILASPPSNLTLGHCIVQDSLEGDTWTEKAPGLRFVPLEAGLKT